MTRRRSVADHRFPPDCHSRPVAVITHGGLRPPFRTLYHSIVALMVTALFTVGSALRLSGVRTSPALVTVITPAYNVGPWIGEAIDSVRCQTEGRFEYIVVDDGS